MIFYYLIFPIFVPVIEIVKVCRKCFFDTFPTRQSKYVVKIYVDSINWFYEGKKVYQNAFFKKITPATAICDRGDPFNSSIMTRLPECRLSIVRTLLLC